MNTKISEIFAANIEFEKSSNKLLESKDIVAILKHEFVDNTGKLQNEGSNFILISNSFSAFKINYKIKIEVEVNSAIKIKYYFSRAEIIQICLFLIAFVLTLSQLRFNIFAIIGYISILLFYFFSTSLINSQIRKKINKAAIDFSPMIAEIFSDEQALWQKEHDLCNACGFKCSVYDSYCPDCGIILPRKAKEKPINHTWNTDLEFIYKLKKKN